MNEFIENAGHAVKICYIEFKHTVHISNDAEYYVQRGAEDVRHNANLLIIQGRHVVDAFPAPIRPIGGRMVDYMDGVVDDVLGTVDDIGDI